MGGELLFPYMAWAKTEARRSPFCLSQSGLPTPALAGLAASDAELLAWPGDGALAALEALLAERYGVAPERVIVTTGGTGAMLVAAARWFRPARGERTPTVLAERPRYQPLGALVELFGAELVDLERAPERGFQFDLDQALGLARRARGALHVFLTNPHNPSGAVLDGSSLSALAAAAAASGGVLIACEAYLDFAPPKLRRPAALLAENAVSIGTLTKAYGLGPLRIGWMVLGEALAGERAALVDRAFLAWVDPPTASLVAARRALEQRDVLEAAIERVERDSRPLLARWLARSSALEAFVPPFGVLSFPRVRGVRDTRALQRALAREWGVDVVAGEDFARAGHLRVCCAVPPETLAAALERLEAGLAAYARRGLDA